MTKTKLIHLTGILFLFFVNSQLVVAQSDTEPDFVYETIEEIENSEHYSIELTPFNMYIRGMFIGLGLGAKAQVADFNQKFSLTVDGTYNYVNYSYDGNKLDFSTDPSEKTTATAYLNTSVGYTFLTETEKEETVVRLKGNNRSSTVSIMPAKTMYNYSAHIGYNMLSTYSTADFTESGIYVDTATGETFVTENSRTFEIKEINHNITIGVKRRKSVDNVYMTDKYGKVSESSESEIYGDLLINISSNVPDLYRYNYNPFGSTPNQVQSITPATEDNREQLLSSVDRLPVGLRVGVRQASRALHGVSWEVKAAINPGRYTEISDLVGLQLGLSYRFMKDLK